MVFFIHHANLTSSFLILYMFMYNENTRIKEIRGQFYQTYFMAKKYRHLKQAIPFVTVVNMRRSTHNVNCIGGGRFLQF